MYWFKIVSGRWTKQYKKNEIKRVNASARTISIVSRDINKKRLAPIFRSIVEWYTISRLISIHNSWLENKIWHLCQLQIDGIFACYWNVDSCQRSFSNVSIFFAAPIVNVLQMHINLWNTRTHVLLLQIFAID